jgi:hypothetical protein
MLAIEAHLHEHLEIQAELTPIEQSHAFFDDAHFLEALDPAPTRRGRQADGSR